MQLLSFSDLQTRWGYTRAGIHKLAKAGNFPALVVLVSNGKIRIFKEADIEAYEKDKPWLFDVKQKQQRQRLFMLLNSAKANQQEQKNILQYLVGNDAKNEVAD